MRHFIIAAAIAAAFVGIAYWYIGSEPSSGHKPGASKEALVKNTAPLAADSDEAVSPFAVSDIGESDGTSTAAAGRVTSTVGASSTEASLEISSSPDIPADWAAPLRDEQFVSLVELLKTDSALFQQLVDDFRQEMDPERKQRLGMLLAAVGGDDATTLASELIFSGDNNSRALGMRMLQEVQPGNARARDIVSGMLATEVQPEILLDALSAISKPGVTDAQSRALLSDQVAFLTTHQDSSVRSVSLDVLSRWSRDGRYTDTILAGLEDQSEYVRSSAAYSLVDHEDPSSTVMERLMGVVRDPEELKEVKRAAILALQSMPLSDTQLAELATLERQLNTQVR